MRDWGMKEANIEWGFREKWMIINYSNSEASEGILNMGQDGGGVTNNGTLCVINQEFVWEISEMAMVELDKMAWSDQISW